MIVIWSPTAAAEFDECINYIAEKSSASTAKRWKNKVIKSIKTLETFPKAGRKIGKYRRWQAHKNYYVIYEPRDGFVDIIHFRHSKRKPLKYKAK